MDFLRHLLQEDWRHLRRQGRRAYVLRHHVVPGGLAFGAAFAAWWMYDDGYTLADALTVSGLARLGYCVSASAVLSYADGLREWRRRERRYAERGGR